MLYIKVTNGSSVTAEAIAEPSYVRRQAKNNLIVICLEQYAQGILSKDSSTVYQLAGRDSLGDDLPTAEIIYQAEYEELVAGITDPDDEAPVTPPDDPNTEILTRAQLTEKVLALEDELAAAKILLGVTE